MPVSTKTSEAHDRNSPINQLGAGWFFSYKIQQQGCSHALSLNGFSRSARSSELARAASNVARAASNVLSEADGHEISTRKVAWIEN